MNHITIAVDPRYPQRALELTTNLLSMVMDHVTTERDFDLSGEALMGIHALMGAILDAHRRVADAIHTNQQDARGLLQPMKPIVGFYYPPNDAAAPAAPVDPEAPPAPSLTEPRRTARRAERAA